MPTVMSALPPIADMCDAKTNVAKCQKQTYSRSRCWLANSMIAKMDKPLAEVFSTVKFGNCA
jgi:hypothetical protein